MTSAYGYLRVSGKGQLSGDGFPRQREAIEGYAAANGLGIAAWYEEKGVCGATEWEDRPAWSAMVGNLNGVHTIVIERLDRLARDLLVQEYILLDLARRGVTLISVYEADLDSNPTRVLFRQIMGAIAQYDKTMLTLKLRAARVRKRATSGRCEGVKPYGQHPERPEERMILQHMTILREQGLNSEQIAANLNSQGTPTRKGGDSRWHGSTVARILGAMEKGKGE